MLLQLNGITLKRGVTILDDISWAVEPGQNWVILGSNGSGKTSMLNVLMGYEQPSSGRFMMFGEPFGSVNWQHIRKRIGIVSSAIGQRIQPDQTAQSVVIAGKSAEVNSWKNISDNEIKEAKRWLYLVGIEHLAERKWGVLSQGERQRLMIARALVIQPKLLILDEPCAGLDPVARETFLTFLEQILTQEFKIPTILVTHHVEEILPMFSHVMMMSDGKVIKSGHKDDILNSANVSQVFKADIVVQPVHKRYYLHIVPDQMGG